VEILRIELSHRGLQDLIGALPVIPMWRGWLGPADAHNCGVIK